MVKWKYFFVFLFPQIVENMPVWKAGPILWTEQGETEQEGFEPPVPFGTTVFKTVALSRSATAPNTIIKGTYEKTAIFPLYFLRPRLQPKWIISYGFVSSVAEDIVHSKI